MGVVGRSGRYLAAGYLLTRVSRVVARMADRVCVASDRLGRRLPNGVSYTALPAGPDLDVFTPGPKDEARRDLNLPLDRKLVLFCGTSDVPRKRFPLAQMVVEMCAKDIPVELIAITREPPPRVAMYMRAADALLLTSLHEGAPTMVKEALACGTRVVSVDVGDVRETIEGVEGCAISEGDSAEEISRTLSRVLTGPPATNARARAEQYGEERNAAKLVTIYEELISQS